MSAPRLLAVYFDARRDDRWRRMAQVLAASAAQHCPGWVVDVRGIQPAPMLNPSQVRSLESNSQKLHAWREAVDTAADGDRLLLIDADTVLLQPIDAVWDQPFDLAYTVRRRRSPFNAGVIFVRVSAATRAFMRRWVEENDRLLQDLPRQRALLRIYTGINQSALGVILEEPVSLDLLQLPCAEWNCEDTSWEEADARTRILHVKGALRRHLLDRLPADTPAIARLATQWTTIERQTIARGREATPA